MTLYIRTRDIAKHVFLFNIYKHKETVNNIICHKKTACFCLIKTLKHWVSYKLVFRTYIQNFNIFR